LHKKHTSNGALTSEISYDNPPGISGQVKASHCVHASPDKLALALAAIGAPSLPRAVLKQTSLDAPRRDAIEMQDAKDRADRG